MSELERIVGCTLEQVAFAADGYVQLWFMMYPLTSYAPVTLERDGRRWTLPEPGARDVLCDSLGARVAAATADDHSIVITMVDGARLEVAFGLAPEGEEFAAELDDPDITKRIRWSRSGAQDV